MLRALLLFVLVLLPSLAAAQVRYPSPADPLTQWGGVVRHADGAGWYWYQWDGAKWLGTYRVLHRGDINRAPIDVAGRSRQLAQTAPADWPALFAAWDKDTTGSCDGQIANAGYSAALCTATRDAMRAGFPVAAPALPPPPPPPPAEVWKVAPNSTYTTRPTYLWSNGTRSTVAAPERAAVGAECNPAIGAGDYRGVLGRTDRVALCRKQ